jgi:hypothetical protein
MRRSLGRALAIATLSLPVVPSAQAASRLLVFPVVVGGGPEPASPLMTALAEGLRQNPQWAVEQGDALQTLGKGAPALGDQELAALAAQVEQASKQVGQGSSEAIQTLERVRGDLAAAAKKGPRGAKGDELAWRANALLVATLVAAKETERARKAADETALLFPGRKPTDGEHIPAAAAELIAKPSANLGAKLTLKSRPEDCQIVMGGVEIGKSPVEVAILPGETYYAQARCSSGAPAAGEAASASATASFVKKIVLASTETSRQEILDAEFERGFQAEGQRRVRFASSAERRQLEESYARRLAERYDAEVVVLASVGELQGSDWLNARLYLKSGYLNRAGYVRLEAPRANALGRFLATGKDLPDVLKPEEAAKSVAAAPPSSTEPSVDPWYTDVPAWCFLGAGITSIALGRWANSVYHKRQDEGDAERMDFDKQQKLYRDAQSAKFWAGVGTIGGILMASTGVILLLVPQYNNSSGELFVLSPQPLQGGAAVTLGGRF